jgi:hypothetical protein
MRVLASCRNLPWGQLALKLVGYALRQMLRVLRACRVLEDQAGQLEGLIPRVVLGVQRRQAG